MVTYSLQSGDAGVARLRLLADVHERPTKQFLDDIELPPSARCLDVGCGIGAVTQLLLETFASQQGEVRGVDVDVHYLDVARANTARFGERISFAPLAVHDLTDVARYDLVYARFLLSHLAEPREALAGMIRAVRPNAVIAVEDVDFSGAFCHPPSRDFERYLGWYGEMTRGNAADPNLGRELLRMFFDLGVKDLRLSVVLPTFHDGAAKLLAPMTLEHIRDTLEQRGIASPEDVNTTLAGLKAYASDPTTVLSMPRIFQVWGRV